MDQGKFDVLKQETVRMNINTFRSQWTKMDGRRNYLDIKQNTPL